MDGLSLRHITGVMMIIKRPVAAYIYIFEK